MEPISLLETLISEFRDKLTQLTSMIDRNISYPNVPNKIKVAIGMRRTGKTYSIYKEIKKLLDANIPLSRILYINFEDDRLMPLTQAKLASLIDAFYSLYPENHEQKCFLFLDEIQNVTDWPVVVRRITDSKRVEVYLTGSSAKLLSKEIATSLRGRSITTEIWPLSFREYLAARHVSVDTKLFGKKTQDILTQHFINYLNCGGFPETLDYEPDIRLRTLQEYVDVAIYRDIIERYEVKHPALIKYMIAFMLSNVSRPFTINRFYNDVKTQGYKIGKETLYDYVNYIEDAYLAFTVSLYDKSVRRVQTNPKKIFAIDPGLAQAFTIYREGDTGKLFENVVYLDLRRQNCKVHYYLTQERYEIDFLVESPHGNKKLIQVCWDISNPQTKEREYRALEAAQKELNIDAEVLTLAKYLKHGVTV